MMPNPYHEWSRQESSERVRKAWEEGRAKDTRRMQNRSERTAVVGLMITWILAMTAIVLLVVMAL